MKDFIPQIDTKQLLINKHQRYFSSAVNQSILIKLPKNQSETIIDGESSLAQLLYAGIVDPSYTYWIVAADKRGQVHMFDILSGKYLQSYLYSQTSLNDLIFLPELQYVIFTNCQGIIFICDLLTGALRMRIHADSLITCLAWAKYGNDHFLYSGHRDDTLRIWNLSDLESLTGTQDPTTNCKIIHSAQQQNVLSTTNSIIRTILVHPTEPLLYFGDSKGVLTCIDSLYGELIWQVQTSNKNPQCLLFHPITSDLYCPGDDGLIKVFNSTNGEFLLSMQNSGFVTCMAFLYTKEGRMSNQLIVSSFRDIKIWDYESATLIRTLSDVSKTYSNKVHPLNEHMFLHNGCTTEIKLYMI
eukprot:gene15272-17072_t